ncbi:MULTISPECIES: hypothetical protein [unclassified Pseudomonas]|uniref:hypothetical protein n=1 Tax=unclassified Pseudomonas TaxID=196821 RepID=UPI0013C426E1|nr:MULTISPECIES: hypothetical protein [unclassified Pseudomonas]NMX32423.1 hypothetical protein [Pseudomonas sp. WS 5413]WLH55806.1 hypothetical protein PSH73_18070 [Pseudomonas sp. FP2294]
MKKTIVILSLLFLLGACGESKTESSPAITATTERATLTLSDGSTLSYDGKLLYSVVRNGEKGNSRLNKITVKSGAKIAENSLYAQLAKLGYTRAVIDSNGDTFKVHYYKKDQPTIGSVYQEFAQEQNELTTNASIYWEIK